ncbi:uncharacterized protein LOC130206111 isoform X4 [Pseudoliparis swirei]|uniref:uncharacterized protein LOC130206111 isoform X4 n=1 Tax=Pseudoliparis swirei TaxID=2059687 RepID=UPI0024BEE7CE|nr:uncharacterized protein LOC130206111 isoform X4 [Pseudoliparis swirei]
MLTCQQFFYDGGQSPRVLERLQTAALRSSTCAGERRTEPHSRLKFSRWNPTGVMGGRLPLLLLGFSSLLLAVCGAEVQDPLVGRLISVEFLCLHTMTSHRLIIIRQQVEKLSANVSSVTKLVVEGRGALSEADRRALAGHPDPEEVPPSSISTEPQTPQTPRPQESGGSSTALQTAWTSRQKHVNQAQTPVLGSS